jgi:hypothetical protein
MGRSPECDDPETNMFNFLLGIVIGCVAVLVGGLATYFAERDIVRFLLDPNTNKVGVVDNMNKQAQIEKSGYQVELEQEPDSDNNRNGMLLYGGIGWKVRKIFWRVFFCLFPLALFYHSLYWYYVDDFRLLDAACKFNETLDKVYGPSAELIYFESDRISTDSNEERVWKYKLRFLCDEVAEELLNMKWEKTKCLPNQTSLQETIFESPLDQIDNSFPNRSLLCSLAMSVCLIVVILNSELIRFVDNDAAEKKVTNNGGGYSNYDDLAFLQTKYTYTALNAKTSIDGQDGRPYALSGRGVGGFFGNLTGQRAKRIRTQVNSDVMGTLFSYAAYGGALASTFISIFYVLKFECNQYIFTPGLLRAEVISFSFYVSYFFARTVLYFRDLFFGNRKQSQDNAQKMRDAQIV